MRGVVAVVGGLVVLAGCVGAPEPGPCVLDLAMSSHHDLHSVDLTWSPVADAEFYQVNRSVDGGPEEVVGFLPGNVTEYQEDGVPGGVIMYRVAADGNPSECEGVSVHFGGDPPTPPPGECATGLEAIALEDESVRVSWAPVANASAYGLLRSVDGGPFQQHDVVGPGETSYLDLDTEAGTTYAYRVAANGPPALDVMCDLVEVTAVPYFDGPLPLALAGLGTLAAALVVGRRR